MSFRKRFLLFSLALILTGLLALLFAPFIVSNGLSAWIRWKAGQQKLTVKIDKVDAPFLRPVVLRGFHLASEPGAACRIDVTAARATIDLNLKAVLMGLRGRAVRGLAVEGIRAEIHRNRAGATISEKGWNTLQRLLPDNFKLDRFDLRVEDGSTVILFRNVQLSANQVEAGRFQATEVMIASPLLRQTFSELRGATRWEGARLTLAGLSLTRGLDVQSITGDLSHLGKQRVGLEFDLDAFGGKIRARISNEWRSRHSNWNLAGSARDISLAQTSEAFGFTDHVGGLLHACSFNFRGDLRDPMGATTSLWMELTGLTWRARTADVIMLGAAVYNRQIQLEQLYVKQHENQLTLSGEGVLPSRTSDWLSPDFRADISASINDLGSFARLFGADAGYFAGKILVEGTMNSHDRRIGGGVTVAGTSLTLFKTPIDLFNARLNLKPAELEIEQLELERKDDSLHAQGRISMSREHGYSYSGALNATIKDVSTYFLSESRHTGASDLKPTAVDIEGTASANKWDAHAIMYVPTSEPVNIAASFLLPIGSTWNSIFSGPFDATLEFPAVSLAHAPHILHKNTFRLGILSGRLSISETLRYPKISGELELKDGHLNSTLLGATKGAAKLTFRGANGTIDSATVISEGIDLTLHGEIDFNNPEAVAIRLSGNQRIFDLTPPATASCIKEIKLSTAPAEAPAAAAIDEFHLQGDLSKFEWSMELKKKVGDQLSGSQSSANDRTFRFCPGASTDGEVLLLECERLPDIVPPRKRRKTR